MQVRFPKLDFSNAVAHWAPNHEFAQKQNAISLIPAYIEPYLMKAMQKAQPLLEARGASEKLRRETDIFIKQEMQHCRRHVLFNRQLHQQGYDGLLPFEAAYEADYDRLLRTKSLKFNIAYCEAFEGLSATGLNFFGPFDDYIKDADPEVVALFQWHWAEEHEHRTVVYDVYHALYGKGFGAWLYRICTLFYAGWHIGGFQKRAYRYLLEKDRETMTPAEVAASKAREKQVNRDVKRGSLGVLWRIIRPDYNPADRVAPPGVDDILRRYEKATLQVTA